MTARFRYAPRTLIAEALQGGVAFALVAGLLLATRPAAPVAWVLAGAAALFLLYFARAIVRTCSRIEVDERGIRLRGVLGAAIAWPELRGLRLDHYTTRTDRTGGWMQLVLRGTRGAIRVDSGLEGFAQLVAMLHARLLQLGQSLDERTRCNLRGLGIATHD